MTDKSGKQRKGAIPPGQLPLKKEKELKEKVCATIPDFFSEIIQKSKDTYLQLIYTAEIETYHKDNMCLVGDAGLLIPPFTLAGVLKGFLNVEDLVRHFKTDNDEQLDVDQLLNAWGNEQLELGKDLSALARECEGPYIWNMCDIRTASSAEIAEWWTKQITKREPITNARDSRITNRESINNAK
eukprot:Awhi_evm2s15166